MIHEKVSEWANRAIMLNNGIPEIGGRTITIEDWFDRVSGKSWMASSSNPTAHKFAIMSGMYKTPDDDEVLYGKIDGLGYLVHTSWLVLDGETAKEPVCEEPGCGLPIAAGSVFYLTDDKSGKGQIICANCRMRMMAFLEEEFSRNRKARDEAEARDKAETRDEAEKKLHECAAALSRVTCAKKRFV